jgi:L-fucose isomerase-like protein
MRVTPRVGLYGVLEKTEEGWEDAASTLATVAELLSEAGMEVRSAPELVSDDATADAAARSFLEADPDVLLAVVITWSFDHLSLRILKRVNLPLVIMAIPGIRSGSIVGAHQLGCLLTDLGIERTIVYGDFRDRGTYNSVRSYAAAAAVKKRLGRGKLAFIGRRTPGMTPIAFDEVEIVRTFGSQVVSYDWEEIQSAAGKIDSAAIQEQVSALTSRVGTVSSTNEALSRSVALYLALRQLARAEGILAFGIGCYPHQAGTACLAIALLCEAGIPAACEGDLNSGIVMYLIQSFTGEPAHFGEILQIDERENSIVSSHCGCAAPSLAAGEKDVALAPVRIWNRGVCIRFPARSAPDAVYANLVGRKGTYRMCGVAGRAVQSEMVFEGNPVKFTPDCSWERLMRTIDEHGFGHHWMMGYGNTVDELRYFCRLSGITGVFPGSDGS